MRADNGEDVAHYLATHPTETKRLSELPVWDQLREIGKLEAKLAIKEAPPQKPSKAPAPITPVSGTTPANSDGYEVGMPFEKFVKLRNKELGRRVN